MPLESINRFIADSRIHKLFVLKMRNLVMLMKSLMFSLGTCAISSSRVPPGATCQNTAQCVRCFHAIPPGGKFPMLKVREHLPSNTPQDTTRHYVNIYISDKGSRSGIPQAFNSAHTLSRTPQSHFSASVCLAYSVTQQGQW